jgi:hypothetical protein
VQPTGLWKKYSQFGNSLTPLLLAWGGGILLGYGTLILIGKIILQEWTDASMAFGFSVLGFYLVRRWFLSGENN